MIDPGGSRRRAVVGLLLLVAGVACRPGRIAPIAARWSPELAPLRIEGDSGTTDTIAPGALHRSFLVRRGPWAVHVLDIDRSACWVPVAVKGANGAIGRSTTSALAKSVASASTAVAGGVNADFFLFDPPGVPTGAHVSGGSVVTGPGARPVFAIDQNGRPWIGTLSVSGGAVSGGESVPIDSWNRMAANGVSWFDARYGPAVDTLWRSLRVVLSDRQGTVQSIDSSRIPMPIPASGGVLVLGPRAPESVRELVLGAALLRKQFSVSTRLQPIQPREAVGGFPILVRDSMEVPGLDSAGAANFAPVRHPRTIIGVAAGGRRLLLITIDGRQPGYSAGTTNRESAAVALALGATAAINLDGGGSTTMALARDRGDSVSFEVVNRPSDPTGERPVGNALVVVRLRDRTRC